jgi:hypothetical protein
VNRLFACDRIDNVCFVAQAQRKLEEMTTNRNALRAKIAAGLRALE